VAVDPLSRCGELNRCYWRDFKFASGCLRLYAVLSASHEKGFSTCDKSIACDFNRRSILPVLG
jgi:hypothetical protein